MVDEKLLFNAFSLSFPPPHLAFSIPIMSSVKWSEWFCWSDFLSDRNVTHAVCPTSFILLICVRPPSLPLLHVCFDCFYVKKCYMNPFGQLHMHIHVKCIARTHRSKSLTIFFSVFCNHNVISVECSAVTFVFSFFAQNSFSRLAIVCVVGWVGVWVVGWNGRLS